ncbi:MAG TPA: alpha-amylase family glycosyl hydrolase, partial [Spirochaetia bacterium]|nr:alpha-amylase family glycosyl hydrolase [Spirochaetia bacterium]
MKRSLWFLLITPVLFLACQTPVTQGVSTVPSVGATGRGLYGSFDKNIVLLEGFHWTSATDCPVGTTYPNGWYGILSQNASRIAGDGVNMVWFPPVSDAGSTEGYLPRQLNVFTNSYGSQTAQTAAVTAVKNAKMVPIADIVVNHRVGTTDWADFTNPDWGATKTVNYTVTADDEWTGTKSMNGDTGATISSARDLDHKNPTVQNGIKTWLNLVKGLGYQGWRYDMVVGYGASYVGMYNDSTAPVFSVGEYWDYNA